MATENRLGPLNRWFGGFFFLLKSHKTTKIRINPKTLLFFFLCINFCRWHICHLPVSIWGCSNLMRFVSLGNGYRFSRLSDVSKAIQGRFKDAHRRPGDVWVSSVNRRWYSESPANPRPSLLNEPYYSLNQMTAFRSVFQYRGVTELYCV